MKRTNLLLLLTCLLCGSMAAQAPEYGLASYYADQFQGKPTASGELYDAAKLTAAHKTHAFGTNIRITRMDNRQSVEVRVNDRGPFISGRVVDLSRAAAAKLGILEEGSVSVMVEVVGKKDTAPAAAQPAAPAAAPAEPPAGPTAGSREREPRPAPAQTPAKAAAQPRKESPAAQPERKKTTSAASPAAVPPQAKPAAYQPFDLYELTLKRPEKKGFGVQVAALTTQDALFRKVSELQDNWFTNILVSVSPGKKSEEVQYKVILGTFPTEKEAAVYKDNLKKNKKIDGFVVDLAGL